MDNSVEYKLMCVKSPEIQQLWKPKDGDYMVSKTSYCGEYSDCSNDVPCQICLEMCNTWVISGHHHGHESVGGDSWFYGGSPCNRNGGCLMTETHCFVMNESGESQFSNKHYISKKSKMLWLPRQDQIQKLFLGGCCNKTKITLFLDYLQTASYNPHMASLEQLWLMYYMDYRHDKQWDETDNVKEWTPIN